MPGFNFPLKDGLCKQPGKNQIWEECQGGRKEEKVVEMCLDSNSSVKFM